MSEPQSSGDEASDRVSKRAGVLGRVIEAGLWNSNTGLCLGLLAALALLLSVVNWHYPINNWLFWRYFWIWALTLFWAVSCLSAGTFILGKLRPQANLDGSFMVIAFPLGVVAFQLTMFVVGLVGLLGAVTFVLIPLGFAASGARQLTKVLRTLPKLAPAPKDLGQLLVVVFGLAGIGLIYFQILSPEAFHWDARWYHLPIAQQYALQGAIRPFPEGWWLDGQPHSASLLYTWAFLFPRALLFDRLELCVHIEFMVFLATIASIPTLVRQLAPGLSARGTWAAIFVFPGIFLYDSNLAGAADHIAGLLSIPIALSLIQLWRRWERTEAILFGTFIGAAVAAKFSTWSMVVFPLLVFAARAGRQVVVRMKSDGSRPQRLFAPFLIASGLILAISAQHWLRNWIWYGDPLYPILHDYFHVHPWSAESLTSYNLYKSFTSPPPPGWQGVKEALLATFTFAFIPNDWPVFHRNVPVFGFLFTLSMFCVPFLRVGARILLTYVGIMVAIVFWYLTTHQDRYLQAWLPVMVACTMATFGLAWQKRSPVARGLVVLLFGFQIIWGSDVPFFPTHNLMHDSSFRVVSNFIASGFLRTPNRLRLFGDEGLVGERLPPDSNLLLHESNLHVGFGSRTVTDQWQGRLSYASLGSPEAIYREFADMKVTHMAWEAKMSNWNSIGHDLAFLGFALNYGVDPVVLGQLTLAGFPTTPPQGTFNEKVAVLGCNNPYRTGIYKIGKLTIPEPGQPWAEPDSPETDIQSAVGNAGFLAVDPACTPTLPPEVATQFHPPVAGVRSPLLLYVRRK